MNIAGLDFGTSGVKLSVVDSNGTLLASTSASYETFSPSEGFQEQYADHWWNAAKQALSDSGVSEQIDALGITGQMQDLILVAGNDAIGPVLLYSDIRASSEHQQLLSQFPTWESVTGNHQDVSNVAAKIAWLAEHDSDALRKAEKLLFSAAGYFAWKTTGVAACDVLTASTTGLLDVSAREWFRDLTSSAGAREDQLPTLVGRTEDAHIGNLHPQAAEELGLRSGIPIVMAMGDAGATTDGLVGSAPGDAYLYLGATGWLAAVTPASQATVVSPIHSLVMPGWEHRLRIGAVQSAGIASEWARKRFLPKKSFAEIDQLVAERVCDIEALRLRPLTLPGLTGERTPLRDPEFRGAFIGVHEGTLPEDFYLGILTGVAMGLRHAAQDMGWQLENIALVGGASRSVPWRQILADVFNATIITGTADSPGTHSAIRVCREALGVKHTSQPLLATSDNQVSQTEPSELVTEYARLTQIHRGLYSALAPTFHQLAI